MPHAECMFGSCVSLDTAGPLRLPSFEINAVLNGLTVSVWYRRASMETKKAWAVLLDLMGEDGKDRIRFLLNLDNPRALAVLVEGVVDLVLDDEQVELPGWHHATLSVSAVRYEVSVDGKVSVAWNNFAPPAWMVRTGTVGNMSLYSAETIENKQLEAFSGWIDELSIHDAPCTQIEATCPDGWEAVGSKCLMALEEALSFDAAVDACAALHATLPMVYSQEEAQSMYALVNASAWLGAAADSDGGLRWLDRSALAAPPDVVVQGASGARCLQVQANSTEWKRSPCEGTAKVVCQRSRWCEAEREGAGAKCLACPCLGCATRRRLCHEDARDELIPQKPLDVSLHTVGVESMLQVSRLDVRDSISDLYASKGLLVDGCDGHGRVWCLPTPALHGTFDIRFPIQHWERQRATSRRVVSASVETEQEAGQVENEEAGSVVGDVAGGGSGGVDDGEGDEGIVVGVAAGCAAMALSSLGALVVYYRRSQARALAAAKGGEQELQVLRVRLVTIRDGQVEAEIDVNVGERVVLGREAEAPFTLDHDSCSRQHAMVELRSAEPESAPQLFITDLGAQNGTRVDGVRLVAHEVTPLRNGQTVSFGALPKAMLVTGLPNDGRSPKASFRAKSTCREVQVGSSPGAGAGAGVAQGDVCFVKGRTASVETVSIEGSTHGLLAGARMDDSPVPTTGRRFHETGGDC